MRPHPAAPPPLPAKRLVVGAAVATVVTKLPVFLLGGLAILVRDDLALTESRLGTTVAVFFAVTALTSIPGGRLTERIGSRPTVVLAASTAALMMAGVALATQWWHLTLLLGLAGIANGLSEPATNFAIATAVRGPRQGLSFGIKQSAAPVTTLVAGLSVPVVGLTVGWRWAFGFGAVLALLTIVATPVRSASAITPTGGRYRHGSPKPALALLALAFGLGTAASTALAAFLVDAAAAGGFDLGMAGVLLAVSSVMGIISRWLSGWLADRRSGGHLLVVALMLLVGGLGMALIAVGQPWLIALGALLGFGFGWGWTGLFNFAVARLNPNNPGESTAILLFGAAIGASLGPLAFGLLISVASFALAWSAAAGACVLAAGLCLLGRQMLRADLASR